MRNKVLLLLIFIASPPRPPDPPRTPIHGECTASRVPLEEYFYFIFFACILFVGLFVYLFSLYVRRAQFFFLSSPPSHPIADLVFPREYAKNKNDITTNKCVRVSTRQYYFHYPPSVAKYRTQ